MLLQCRGKVHFFAHTLGVVRMELYVDLSFKQRTNSEFIVSERKRQQIFTSGQKCIRSKSFGFINRRASGAQWRASLWPVDSSSHSSVASTCWWAFSWVLSVQEKCVQRYWCLAVFKGPVPRILADYHKHVRKEVFPILLSRYEANDENSS